ASFVLPAAEKRDAEAASARGAYAPWGAAFTAALNEAIASSDLFRCAWDCPSRNHAAARVSPVDAPGAVSGCSVVTAGPYCFASNWHCASASRAPAAWALLGYRSTNCLNCAVASGTRFAPYSRTPRAYAAVSAAGVAGFRLIARPYAARAASVLPCCDSASARRTSPFWANG